MKPFFFYCTLSLVVVACEKLEDLLTFTISNQASVRIESSSPINSPIPILTPEITTNSSQQFESNNTRADLVKDIRLSELNLAIDLPEDKTFSFLKSIHLYMEADGLPEIELAYQDNINSSANTLVLTATNAKLDAYIKAPSYQLRTELITKEILTEDVDVDVNMKFKVTADPK